jgi:hypothetical protein
MTPRFVVRLHRPKGEGWRRLLDQPYVETTSQTLDLPTSRVAIRLVASVNAEEANEIADQFRSCLEGGTVTVELES